MDFIMLTPIILLWYLTTQIFMIYANPLYQTFAPPCSCQHSPWYHSDLIFEPSNINPYTVIPQTLIPPYQTSSNNQDYVNKILSNPSIRTILDPNTKLFDCNGKEIPRTVPESGHNVINNYIIIPPEVLKEQQDINQNGETRKNIHRRKVNSSHKHKRNKNNIVENRNQNRKSVPAAPNSYGKGLRNNLSNESNKNNLIERRPKVTVKNKSSDTELRKDFNDDHVSLKEKQNVIRLKIIPRPNDPKDEIVIQEFRRKFPGIPEELVRSLLTYLKRKLANGEIGLDNQHSYIPAYVENQRLTSTKNKPKIKRGRRKGRKRERGKKHGNQQMNAKKCESTMETKAHKMNNTEKTYEINNETIRYLENTDTNLTLIVQPNEDWKINLTKNDTAEATTTKSIAETKIEHVDFDFKPQNISENVNLLNKDIKDQDPDFETSYPLTVAGDEMKIKQKVNTNETDENIDQIYKPNTDGQKLHYNYNVDNTRLPDLGTEDAVPITANGIFEDYYPDFRGENQLAVSVEEFPPPDFQSEKNHYTDGISKLEELSRERRKYEQNYDKNHHKKFNLNEKNTYEIENYGQMNSDKSFPVSIAVEEETEEITFKAPPALEIPDFETKNVKDFGSFYEEAAEYEPTFKNLDVPDKASVYSDTKNQKYDKAKPSWKKQKYGDLETISARSKVVKYGHNSDDTANIPDDVSDRYSQVVIAESYPDYVV